MKKKKHPKRKSTHAKSILPLTGSFIAFAARAKATTDACHEADEHRVSGKSGVHKIRFNLTRRLLWPIA
jgi:hypothetical protein